MKRRSIKHKLVADINITPFTDVILVLLVIFMITTPLIYQTNIKVNLPKSKSKYQLKDDQKAQVNVTITREGLLYLDAKPVTKDDLLRQVNAMYMANPDLSVVLQADKLAPFQDVVNILDPLRELGITKLNIATNLSDSQKD